MALSKGKSPPMAAEAQSAVCAHNERTGVLFKSKGSLVTGLRKLPGHEPVDPAGMQFVEELLVLQRKIKDSCCPLCEIVYPAWHLYANSHARLQPSSGEISRSEDNGQSDNEAPKFSVHFMEEEFRLPIRLAISPKPKSNVLSRKFTMYGGEYGEAYQVLICCLLARRTASVEVEFQFLPSRPDGQSQEPRDPTELSELFQWYRLFPTDNLRDTHGLHEASRIITAAFRTVSIQQKTEYAFGTQNSVFASIRDELSTANVWPILKFSDNSQGSSGDAGREIEMLLDTKYLSPTWAAKFWLKRYLRLTGQRRLPKLRDVSRLAVIHVRRTAKTPIGRCMDDESVKYVVKSIAAANCLSNQAEEAPFSHIVLYGDFWYSEGLKLKQDVEAAYQDAFKDSRFARIFSNQQPTQHPVDVLFISNPWTAEDPNPDIGVHRVREREMRTRVDAFWKQFRDANFDHIPVQVKTLAIWTMLCERYHPKICVVGHRSGFIEGAGYIGIPIFYLIENRLQIEDTHEHDETAPPSDPSRIDPPSRMPGPGELLWNAAAFVPRKRLAKVAAVLSTFIPICVLEED